MSPCDSLGAELSAYLDGECEAAEAERVRAHVESCADCRQRLEIWRAAGERMRREDATPDAFPQIHSAVSSRLAIEARNAPVYSAKRNINSTRRARIAFAAIAAALVVGAAGFFAILMRPHDVPSKIAKLEEVNRIDALSQQNNVEALRLEIAAIRLRARAAGLSTGELDSLEREARSLLEQTQQIEARVSRVQTQIEQNGLLAFTPTGAGEKSGR